MKKKIFTLLAVMGSLVYANAADQTVSHSEGYNVLRSKISAASNGDVVRVEVGTYFAGEDELEIPAGVTVIGGYSGGWDDKLNRIYPGAAADISEMTVLDGNSLVNTKPKQKHRVATVYGTLEGCLIRNGHARDDNGGGVYVDGGTVQNCIIKGNVAMSVTDNNALGGGAYLTNEGKLINCVVAYNMANNGYGIAGTGEVINNTITANTYAPFGVEVKGAKYQHYAHYQDWGIKVPENITYDDQEITVSDFYLSQTEITTSQFAVFTAAMDWAVDKNNGVSLSTDANIALYDLVDPSQSEITDVKVGDYLNFSTSEVLFLKSEQNGFGLQQIGNDFIYYPGHQNEPMNFVSWFGALAYSLWVGGVLPTEAQWELAARKNQDGSVNDLMYAGSNTVDDVAWSNGAQVKEVATKQANNIGLYDMSGNVWEWCADLYAAPSSIYPDYGNSPDPIYVSGLGTNRVRRGGCFNAVGGPMILAFRAASAQSGTFNYIGLRVVLIP